MLGHHPIRVNVGEKSRPYRRSTPDILATVVIITCSP